MTTVHSTAYFQEVIIDDLSKKQIETKDTVTKARGPQLPKMAGTVKDLSGGGSKVPQMKPPGDILKVTKRKRVKLGSLYANPQKKRRFKPKPSLHSIKSINSTEDDDTPSNVPKKEQESISSSSPRPQILARTTQNPIIPASFPKFHNISLTQPGRRSSSSAKPRTMMGWTGRPQEKSGSRLSRPERRRESSSSSSRVNSLVDNGNNNGKRKEQSKEKVAGTTSVPAVVAKVAKRWPPLRSVSSTPKPPPGKTSTALPGKLTLLASTATPVAAELLVEPVAASSTTLRSILSSRESSYISSEVSNEMSKERKLGNEDLYRLSREKAHGVSKEINSFGSKELNNFGSKEVGNDSKERRFKGKPRREKKEEITGKTNLGDRRGKGMKKTGGAAKQRNDLSEDFVQPPEISNNIESFEDFISFGTKANKGSKEEYDKQPESYSYEVSGEEDNILSLGLGIEEVADSGESDYRSYQYRIVSSSEEEEKLSEPRTMLSLQPVSNSEDGLFHPESQLFPTDPAAFMRVDFDQNFGEKSSEKMENQEKETEAYLEEHKEEEREKASVEVDLSHLPMEHRGEAAAWSPPSPPTSFLQFGHLPPPRPPSPPPKPPVAPKESLPSPTDYPHPLPLPKEPLPSATERDGPRIV